MGSPAVSFGRGRFARSSQVDKTQLDRSLVEQLAAVCGYEGGGFEAHSCLSGNGRLHENLDDHVFLEVGVVRLCDRVRDPGIGAEAMSVERDRPAAVTEFVGFARCCGGYLA